MGMEKIGFIGLKPMSLNLVKGLCNVMVNDINLEAENELVSAGAEAASLAEIGGACEIIFTILPNGEIVKQVLFGEGGVASTLKRGSLIVDMSSVTSADSLYCAQRLSQVGAAFLDSPVSGGEPGAVNATLAFMCGGTEDSFKRAMPYFDIMGSSALLIGGTGSGSVAKLANQIIVNLTIAAVSEAMVFAAKAGADPQKGYMAIRGGLAGSAVLDAKAPMMFNRNFKPGGKISVNHKDIKNVMAAAHSIDVPLPLTSQLFEIMQYLKIHGHMNDDHSAILRYFENMADVTVEKGQPS